MSTGDIIVRKFMEIKTQIIKALSEIQAAGILNTLLFLVLSVVIYLISVLAIKFTIRKLKYLEEVRKPLRKLFFYFSLFLFWQKVPGGFAGFMANVMLFFFMLKLLKVMDFFIMDILIKRYARQEVLQIFRDIIKAVIWLVIILITLRSLFGFSVQDIAITSAVLTAALGFAFQDTLVNIIAGISIIMEKTFKIGDVVQLTSGEIGVVTQINWRTTRFKNRQNQIVVLPNKELATAQLIHFNFYNQIARIFTVGVSYQSPPGEVKKLILDYLAIFPEILNKPEPEVFLKDYKDFYIEYQIRFFIEDFSHSLQIEDRVKTGLWYLFKRNNVEIPLPIRNVFLQNPEEEKIPEGEKIIAFAYGENVPLFLEEDSFFELLEGSLVFKDKGQNNQLEQIQEGEYLYVSPELKGACREIVSLVPGGEDVKLRLFIPEAGKRDDFKEEVKEKSKEKLAAAQEKQKTNWSGAKAHEENFIDHFLNINFYNRKGKK